jgi:lipoate-protein ligase A
MKKPWRLLMTTAARGAWNMAVDEAILEAIGSSSSLPTLRLYAWDPSCLSLGTAQPISDVDIPRLQKYGWEMVRRPTGGRAVLHTDELTYSVIAPLDEPLVAGSVLESYSRLATVLVEALHLLHLPVEVHENTDPGQDREIPRSRGKVSNPVCFEVPSAFEITVGGRKLVGSAQARRKEGVLQHGSLPLVGDLTRIIQVLTFPDDIARAKAAIQLLERATTVETALGQVVTWDDAAHAICTAFQSVFPVDLQPVELNPQEQNRIDQLVANKYNHPDWNRKDLNKS